MDSFQISVPATSANIGPGYDSAGVAVSRYLKLHVVKQEKWEFQHNSPFLPADPMAEKHYIYHIAHQIADHVGKSLSPCKVVVESEIPLARGLGSSASAIVAGIELANQLLHLHLSTGDKLHYAVSIEGHPDNVTPCLLGGLVISVMIDGKVIYKQIPTIDTDIVIYIPDFEVRTTEARKVLPKHLTMEDAAKASGISNLMTAALLTGDYKLAGQMMEKDMFHEPYRAKLIPDYKQIRNEATNLGAYGTVLSGSGPTMISFVPTGDGTRIAEDLQKKLPSYEVKPLKLDRHGLQVSTTSSIPL